MIGIIVQLALSWLIIWLFERKNLAVLGFRPTKSRINHFIIFFLISAIICSTGFLMKMYFGNNRWHLNPDLTFNLVLSGIWWNIKSVLFEELIFRGVLLYILIKKLGPSKAIIISAIAFGIYHWFSFGVFGNPIQMVIVFFITGLMGLLLAYGYAKTFSLYVPVAIHFGWNLTQIFIFSSGPIGNGMLIPSGSGQFSTNSYFIFGIVTFLPLLMVLGVNWLVIQKFRQGTPER